MLSVFLGAFTVIFVGFLYPLGFHESDIEHGTPLRVMVWRPLFQLLGELFLEEIKCGDDDGPCEQGKQMYTGPTVLFLYMLIGNVVLVNLLIAMVGHKYVGHNYVGHNYIGHNYIRQ